MTNSELFDRIVISNCFDFSFMSSAHGPVELFQPPPFFPDPMMPQMPVFPMDNFGHVHWEFPHHRPIHHERCSDEHLLKHTGKKLMDMETVKTLPGLFNSADFQKRTTYISSIFSTLGKRCFTDDIFKAGDCLTMSCNQVLHCKTKGSSIVGKCADRWGHPEGLCCMPSN